MKMNLSVGRPKRARSLRFSSGERGSTVFSSGMIGSGKRSRFSSSAVRSSSHRALRMECTTSLRGSDPMSMRMSR